MIDKQTQSYFLAAINVIVDSTNYLFVYAASIFSLFSNAYIFIKRCFKMIVFYKNANTTELNNAVRLFRSKA